MRTRRGATVPDRSGRVLPIRSSRGVVREGRAFRLERSFPEEPGGIPSVKTSSSHGAGTGALWKPRRTDCTEIGTSPVSTTGAGGIPMSSRSSGIARMKGRTRCGVTLRDVGIDSLRGPVSCTQYTDAGTSRSLHEFQELSAGKMRGAGGRALSAGPRRRGCVVGQSLVAGTARRRASLVLVTDGAFGHGGVPRPPFSSVTRRARHRGAGMHRVGKDDVPVRFRQSPPGRIGEAVPPGLRRVGGLAVTGGAIPGRCRPGIGRVRTVAGSARAIRDGHVAVVPEGPFTRSTRHHQGRGEKNDGE
jgi:hypothetical protein